MGLGVARMTYRCLNCELPLRCRRCGKQLTPKWPLRPAGPKTLRDAAHDAEADSILEALKLFGTVKGAAVHLGYSDSGLYRKMAKLGINWHTMTNRSAETAHCSK